MDNMFCILVIYFLGIIISPGMTAKVPQDLQLCKHGDGECIKNTINFILKNKVKGHPGLNLVAVNPIKISTVSIIQGKESPVNIDLQFYDSNFYSVNNYAVKVSGFDKNIGSVHELYFKGDQVSLIGPYKISGKVLILPISGNGNSNITLVNPESKMTFTGKPVEKNGKIHMQIEKFKLSIQISRMYIHLENLFNGDKALGDNMNLFLNENWKDIYGEIRESINKAFGLIFERIIQNVFDKFPYDELFLKS